MGLIKNQIIRIARSEKDRNGTGTTIETELETKAGTITRTKTGTLTVCQTGSVAVIEIETISSRINIVCIGRRSRSEKSSVWWSDLAVHNYDYKWATTTRNRFLIKNLRIHFFEQKCPNDEISILVQNFKSHFVDSKRQKLMINAIFR